MEFPKLRKFEFLKQPAINCDYNIINVSYVVNHNDPIYPHIDEEHLREIIQEEIRKVFNDYPLFFKRAWKSSLAGFD